MDTLLLDFHFVRPLWLLGCIPAATLFGILWFVRSRSSGWNRAIDGSLLPHLLDNAVLKQQNWPLTLVLMAWILSCLSLAGPVWEKLPQPVQKKEDTLILIQDLSLSMYAQDLSPNRLTRVQHKLADILKQRIEGTTALIVYSGDAHIVSPLTDDSKTIAAMIPALSPGIMPVYGSNAAESIKLALQLLKDTGLGRGRFLLLTDEVEENDARKITRLLQNKNISLHVMGIGTSDGGPIPISDGGFLKDNEGNIVVPRLNRRVLQKLARENNGRYSDMQLDDNDINYLLAEDMLAPDKDEYRQLDREFDQWKEMGPWLLLGVLPIALFAFRRGWLLSFIILLTLGTGESQAMTWQDLWLRRDQQAANALAENNPQTAAELFQSPEWKGVAEYKADNFADAADAFGQSKNNADSLYNNGNALARAGKLEEAIQAYDKSLVLDPEMEDARFNKQLLEQVLQQQQQENSQNQEGDQQQDQQQSEQNSQDQQEQQDTEGQNQQQKESGAEQDQKAQQDDQQSQGADQQESDQEQAGQKNQDTQQDEQQTKLNPQKQEDKDALSQDQQVMSKQDTGEQDVEDKPAQQAVGNEQDSINDEEKQAMEQWLRQVPDNPGGLLRRKFEYESRQNRKQRSSQQDTKIW